MHGLPAKPNIDLPVPLGRGGGWGGGAGRDRGRGRGGNWGAGDRKGRDPPVGQDEVPPPAGEGGAGGLPYD